MKLKVMGEPLQVPKENDLVMVGDMLHIAKELPSCKKTLFCLEGRDNSFYGEFDTYKELAKWFENTNIHFIVFSLDDYDIEIKLNPK